MSGPKRGKFFAIEGGEGSGKTTLLKRLKAVLPSEEFVFTREPGGTTYAECVGRAFLDKRHQPTDAFEELLAVLSARSHHVRHVIKPELEKGRHVVCDRWVGSTYGYQIFQRVSDELRRLFLGSLDRLSRHEVTPDFWVFLDVEPEVGLARLPDREGEATTFDRKRLDFHDRVREGLKSFFLLKTEVLKLDTTYLSPDQVFDEVYDELSRQCSLSEV